MLKECWRVLAEGGKLRVSTPDLAFLVDLYRNPKTEQQKAYIDWSIDRWLPTAPAKMDTFLINNYFRAWGHQFIYDEKVLRLAMNAAGFGAICKCGFGESEDPELRGLENDNRMAPGILRMETMVFEGTKRAAGVP